KIMSLKDELIIQYFILTTRVDMETIKSYRKELEGGLNPRDIKMKLAFELVRFYHSKEDAKTAETYFVSTFSKKEIPKELVEFKPQNRDLISVLIETNLSSSKSEARRIVEQGGVKVDGEVVKDASFILPPNSTLQKGKINFIKII